MLNFKIVRESKNNITMKKTFSCSFIYKFYADNLSGFFNIIVYFSNMYNFQIHFL